VLLKCFAGCSAEKVVDALGLKMSDLFPEGGRGDVSTRKSRATVQHPSKTVDTQGNRCCNPENNGVQQCNGLTLAGYAEAKKLPVDFLRGLGLSDMAYMGAPAVRIPYHNQDGTEGPVRFRVALGKGQDVDGRFKWKKGSKPCLYGLERKRADILILCEGESDCHSLWYHGFPALGTPGASNWKEDRDALHFDGCSTIYAIKEPDDGGEALIESLRKSRVKDRVKVVSLNGHKDPSALFLRDPAHFKENFNQAMSAAVPLTDIEKVEADAARAGAWTACRTLAERSSILDMFTATMRAMGVAGEEKIARLLFLALISRYLQRPTSVALKGPSSGGKSFMVETVLSFFPESAYYALTSMSDRALAYSEEPLKNRFLVIYEAAGLTSDFASYILRSLLSEGRIRYETVEKTKDGLESRVIEREGPTGCIVTTTATALHPENETRMVSLVVSDTAEQTRAVLRALAKCDDVKAPDLKEWHALQEWLDYANHDVVIPYRGQLADLIPPVAVRLRRDFTMVLNLIRAHAILHQATREKDQDGRIIASLDDYSAVRELISDAVSDGIGATVPDHVRETVKGVQSIVTEGHPHATVQQCATVLKLDKSAASRRVKVCLAKGYLVNMSNHKGKPMQLVIGDPLPEDLEILPSPEKLDGCTVAAQHEGIDIPPSPPQDNEDGLADLIRKGPPAEDDLPDVEVELWS
jgi:hypothetical protein